MHADQKFFAAALGAVIAACPAIVLSQPTAPPDQPESPDRAAQRAAELDFVRQASKQWQEQQPYGKLGKGDPSFRARRDAYENVFKKLHEERDAYLAEFANTRDEKTKMRLIKQAYEIAHGLNNTIKPDMIKPDGTVVFGSKYDDWDPASEVTSGLKLLNEEMTRELDELFKLINANKQAETREALDRVRRTMAKLKSLDAKQAFTEKYLFGNAMFIGDTRFYAEQIKSARDRNNKLLDLYEDYEKAYDRKWPTDPQPEEKNNGTSASTTDISNSAYPGQAEKFAWLLGTWDSYSPWGDQTRPTGGTLVFTIGTGGKVEGRIGKLNERQKELGYSSGMLVYRGFYDVRSYGSDGTTRFESFDGEFLQIHNESSEWRAESIGVRQNGILYQSPPAYSHLGGPFRKAEITI
ncbi:hypothetical protein [Pontixanthobacter aquaemixtae]|uniref:Uncharacterized protein n=1 Tax=Pontixanthobacter aquaemixtae TaxID=1958940 RepID=A0A844ZSL3_9SPHN|nr:hypothetical protein [Pontixanthobacter aquaemixtae]MXO89787.1 hypothetical protein [Pontixanthobacter aquaemixtae]